MYFSNHPVRHTFAPSAQKQAVMRPITCDMPHRVSATHSSSRDFFPSTEYSRSIATLRKELGLLEEGGHKGGTASHPPQRRSGMMAKFLVVLRTQVGERMVLPVSPQMFHGVEFRGVRRQPLQADSPLAQCSWGKR